MSVEKIDPRIKRTQLAFQKALLELLKVKPIEQIRIKEIAAHAGFSRHAFYSHFDSKEALLFSYADDLFAEIAELVRGGYEGAENLEFFELFRKSFDLWREHAEMLKYALQVDKKDLAAMRFRKHSEVIIALYLESRNRPAPDNLLQDYVLEFTIGGWFMLIDKWVREGMIQDSATMAQLLIDVTPLALLIGEQ